MAGASTQAKHTHTHTRMHTHVHIGACELCALCVDHYHFPSAPFQGDEGVGSQEGQECSRPDTAEQSREEQSVLAAHSGPPQGCVSGGQQCTNIASFNSPVYLMPFCPSVSPSIYPAIHQSVCPSICLSNLQDRSRLSPLLDP